jgi:hypothetical protein
MWKPANVVGPSRALTCTRALQHPSVGVIGAEQPGECSVIGELALKFGEWIALVGTRDSREVFLQRRPER